MALAGAIIRTRKERERKRNESIPLQEETPFTEVTYGKDGGGEGSMDANSRKSPTSLKKSASKHEMLRKSNKVFLSQSFDSDAMDGIFESGGLKQAYSAVYIGLILMSIGSVITFVGLGDKGFRTLELKLIGPILCLCGFVCILYKIIECIFPKLFRKPNCLRRHKLNDVENSKLNISGIEKGNQNGHGKNNTAKSNSQNENDEVFSPRVKLTSENIKNQRPQSTVPNYIDSTDEDDDFDPGRSKPHLNRESKFIQEQLQIKHQEVSTSTNQSTNQESVPQNPTEIVLTPKTLML